MLRRAFFLAFLAIGVLASGVRAQEDLNDQLEKMTKEVAKKAGASVVQIETRGGADMVVAGPQKKARGGEPKHEADNDLEDVGGEVEVAAEKGERDGKERKGPEEPPREMSGAPELPRANAGHEQVQQQGGGLDHRGSQAEERHDGDATGRARVADRGVEEGDQQNAGSQIGKVFGRHRAKLQPFKATTNGHRWTPIRTEVWRSG